MNFELSEHTKMLQATMKKFVETECLPVERELLRTNPDWAYLPDEIFKDIRGKLKALGLWALDAPPQYGGCGLDYLSCAVIEEEEHKTLLAGPLHSTPFWCPIHPGLFTTSTSYQKEKYLLPLIKGEIKFALAFSEPEAGSDAANIKTTATKDGIYWLINGDKMFCSAAERADFIYLLAVTEKAKGRNGGFTMFLVDKDSPGWKIERFIYVLRPEYSTQLSFNDCKINDSQRLGAIGDGWQLLQAGHERMRLFYAMACLGKAVRSLDLATDYVQRRITFGQPLSTRQAVQWMLVDSAIEVHLTRLMAHKIAWKLDNKQETYTDVAMLKLYSSEMAFRVIDRCIQCMGGIGLSKDLPLERWFREVRVLRIGEGPTEIQKVVVARSMFRGWRP